MASTYPTHGAGGKVMVGAAAVAMMTAWSIRETATGARVRFAGATNVAFLPDGMSEAEVDISAVLNGGDTAQNALAIGATVTLVLHPDAGAAGDDIWSCTGVVTSRGIDLNIDGAVMTSATVAVNGAITKGVVGGG